MTSATRSAVRWIADPIPRPTQPPHHDPEERTSSGSFHVPTQPAPRRTTHAGDDPPTSDRPARRETATRSHEAPEHRTAHTVAHRATQRTSERHGAHPPIHEADPGGGAARDRPDPGGGARDLPTVPTRRTHHPTRTTTHDPRPRPADRPHDRPPAPVGGPARVYVYTLPYV